MSQDLVRKIQNPVVTNPKNGLVYKDNLDTDVWELDWKNMEPILDANQWAKSKSAAVTSDSLKISDAFIGDSTEKAKNMFIDIAEAKKTRSLSKSAAIITSLDYSLLQDAVVIAENVEVITTGVLSQQFEEIATVSVSGKYRDFANDLKWYRNIPEGKSPEPSFGGVSEVQFSVLKHGGAVAITDRARDVINSTNIFQRLVSQLQEVRLRDENLMVAEELESNTGNTEAGVDFGARSGTPPASTQNPLALINELNADFGDSTRPDSRWDLFITKGFIFNEYITNDLVRNVYLNAIPNQLPQDGLQSSAVPLFPPYVSWVRDDVISSSTDGWALNRSAIKKFRGPTRQYTITDPEKEYTKYTTKTHLTVETVKPSLVYNVTDIAA
jgi:hypothetical protein